MDDSPLRAQLTKLVETALAMTAERLARAPAGSMQNMFGSIRNQLEFMRHTVVAGGVPTIAEKNSLSLGVIAVREFEASDVVYCDAICDAVFAFKKLA
jgi:Tsi6